MGVLNLLFTFGPMIGSSLGKLIVNIMDEKRVKQEEREAERKHFEELLKTDKVIPHDFQKTNDGDKKEDAE